MTIRAVVFDIGGILEITPPLGIDEKWEKQLKLKAGELGERLGEVWGAGSLGTISEADVHRQIGSIMGWDAALVNAFMADVWHEYLGTPNTELIQYFEKLHGPYLTGIISNSFVGAREKEQAAYRFEDMTDLIIYSHEVGIRKPDPQIYAITCERLGVQPHEMVFLDDAEPNVIGACEFGIQAVLFKDNAQAIAEINAILNTSD
ncbi:MAG: HAD family phosphatase [Anaerolineae bacterium]|nr:HAD family phosphatase [Anaerolineae bacterium]